MFKYNSENKDNKWKTLLQNVNDNPETQELAINQFYDQLKKDSEDLENGQEISVCGYAAPRIRSSLDKKHNTARDIAIKLFPLNPTKDQDAQKIWSYIQYQRLIAKLSKAFVEQIERVETLNSQFRDVRQNKQRKYFCELKNKPLSSHITNPTAMPVTVSPIKDLQPFFDHLSSNGKVEVEQMEFLRGVQYNDGRMDLCKQVVGPPHIAKLMESLKHNTHIEHFLLGNNIIGLNGATAISDFLQNEHVPQIKTWYIAGNDIDSEGARLIANALVNDQVCEALWLKRNPIGEGAKYLAEMLEVNNKIKILDLDNTAILDEGVAYIMKALTNNTTLRHLYLDANGLLCKWSQKYC